MATSDMHGSEGMVDVGAVLEDYGQFWGWLQAHAEVVVGIPTSCPACPLAIWLDEVVGGEWVVTSLQCHDAQWREVWGLPAWARVFVEGIDTRYGWCDTVTGNMALVVLREVVR